MKSNAVKLLCGVFLAFGLLLSGCAKINPKFEDSLNNAILAKTGDFQNCYETALTKNPNAKGEMKLKLAFSPSSKQAEDASVTASQIKNAGMKKCVSAVAKTIETTELPGTWVDGKYTLDFSTDK